MILRSLSHLRANAKTGSPVWASDIFRKVTLVSLWDEQRRGNSERRSPVISQVSSSPSLDLLTHSHSSSFSLNLWMSCWVETVVLFPVTSECDWWDVKPRETCRGHSKPAHRKQVALKRTLVVCFFCLAEVTSISVCVCSVFLTQRKIHVALKVCRQGIRTKNCRWNINTPLYTSCLLLLRLILLMWLLLSSPTLSLLLTLSVARRP